MVDAISRHYNVVYEDLDKKTKKYLRYKYACVNKNCDKIETLSDIDSISWCMIRCKYSYDYHLRS